ncbi:hypothetical protein CCACVL1_06954 [Corchorus capsularis]|uniref:Uncharacterized protein n=1 Tax=Corchorus capsularis TaxID=210143 RepID=A0A1R3JAT0_COCAP|nr:hypothetical protein CCACVL1_06954 [Corchorus capsularis]
MALKALKEVGIVSKSKAIQLAED